MLSFLGGDFQTGRLRRFSRRYSPRRSPAPGPQSNLRHLPGKPMNSAFRTARFQCSIRPEEIIHPCIAIVTACNPGDQVCSETVNQQADRRLVADLDYHGWWRFRVVGGSPDFQHQEPGWAVATDSVVEAIALGRRWGQVAFFWVDQDSLSLVSCHDGNAEALGSWRARTRFDQPLGPWCVVSE